MIETIIKSVISFVISGALGYCINAIKNYKKKLAEKEKEEVNSKEALMILLQNHLTNTYYVYQKAKSMPDYVYKNWLTALKKYEQLGGDDYVHTLANKMEDWDITKTDILG